MKLFKIAKDAGKAEKLTTEYQEIMKRLEAYTKNDTGLFRDLMRLIGRLIEYQLKEQPNLMERMAKVMGGEVLRLPSDELREEREAGLKQGLQQGICGLIKACQDFQIAKEDVLKKIVENFGITQTEAESYMEQYWK